MSVVSQAQVLDHPCECKLISCSRGFRYRPISVENGEGIISTSQAFCLKVMLWFTLTVLTGLFLPH